MLLKANKRLNIAYLLKESFSQLWEYKKEGWARKFFDNWRASLKWQRLKPYEEFAEMIESHWDGIAALIRSEDKVSLGFVEGLNNKVRVIQCRAYGLRDEEYLRLKVLTCMLPALWIAKFTHSIGRRSLSCIPCPNHNKVTHTHFLLRKSMSCFLRGWTKIPKEA